MIASPPSCALADHAANLTGLQFDTFMSQAARMQKPLSGSLCERAEGHALVQISKHIVAAARLQYGINDDDAAIRKIRCKGVANHS